MSVWCTNFFSYKQTSGIRRFYLVVWQVEISEICWIFFSFFSFQTSCETEGLHFLPKTFISQIPLNFSIHASMFSLLSRSRNNKKKVLALCTSVWIIFTNLELGHERGEENVISIPSSCAIYRVNVSAVHW